MPRDLLDALEIQVWLASEWFGEFDWDEGNNWKPEKRSHSCDQIEECFESFVFAGEIKPYEDEAWAKKERRFSAISEIEGKPFRITFTIRGQKVRYISHRRLE